MSGRGWLGEEAGEESQDITVPDSEATLIQGNIRMQITKQAIQWHDKKISSKRQDTPNHSEIHAG